MRLRSGPVRLDSSRGDTRLFLPWMGDAPPAVLGSLRDPVRVAAADGAGDNPPVLLLRGRAISCRGGARHVAMAVVGRSLVFQEVGSCGGTVRLARADGRVLLVEDSTLETWGLRDGDFVRLRRPLGEATPPAGAEPPRPASSATAPPAGIDTSPPDAGWPQRP